MNISSGQLISLVACFETKDQDLPSSPLTIYKAAKAVYSIQATTSTSIHDKHLVDVLTQVPTKFYAMLSTLPSEYFQNVILGDIHSAFGSLVESLRSSSSHARRAKYTNMTALDKKEISREQLQKCFVGARVLSVLHIQEVVNCCHDKTLLADLCFLYDECLDSDCQHENEMEERDEMVDIILATLSSLLLNNLLRSGQGRCNARNHDELLESVMEAVQILSSGDSTCLGDLQSWQRTTRRKEEQPHPTIVEAVKNTFSSYDSAQKTYLIRMLSSASKSSDEKATVVPTSTMQKEGPVKKNSIANTSAISAVDRLVNQIKTLCPHLGDGYIEAALACYGHDLERTTAALLEGDLDQSTLHPRLQVLDKKLPARKKESKTRYDALTGSTGDGAPLDEEDEEAKQIQKARLKEMEKEAENQAFLLSSALQGEYDDDYDDQYDGMDDGGGIGGADGGMYDVDLDAIRAYNNVAKEIEADRQYWGGNRNLNRQQKVKVTNNANKDSGDSTSGADQDDGKIYRGPDKGKKGRVIGPDGKYLPLPKHRKSVGKNGPKKGGDKSEESNDKQKGTTDDPKMSKIQKRRKNDNKAKIANHHRKERALKKTG